ncbi:MAG: biotin/lipoyl-binding protein, partial [Gemmatimonadales bacterium]
VTSPNEALGASAVEAFPTEIALPVEGAMVRRDTFVLWVEAQGRAAPLRSAPLQAEVSGPVISIPVQEGARVSKGQLLVQIDPAEYELRMRRAEADLAYAHAEFEGLILGDDRLEDAQLRTKRERLARLRQAIVDERDVDCLRFLAGPIAGARFVQTPQHAGQETQWYSDHE